MMTNPDNHNLEDSAELDYRLKTTESNEVIISLPEVKMYSREEVVEILHKSLDCHVTAHEGIRKIFLKQMNKWIEENL